MAGYPYLMPTASPYGTAVWQALGFLALQASPIVAERPLSCVPWVLKDC
jgi:hypothetical protein